MTSARPHCRGRGNAKWRNAQVNTACWSWESQLRTAGRGQGPVLAGEAYKQLHNPLDHQCGSKLLPWPRGRVAAVRPKVANSVRSVTPTQARTMFATGLGIARV